MCIKLIVAVGNKNVIGHQNTMPWGRLPRDLRYFKEQTMGHPVVMGRKTYESIKGELPGRDMFVLTHHSHYSAPHATLLFDSRSVLHIAERKTVFVIGGEEIYNTFFPHARAIYLTHIHGNFHGDKFFPTMNPGAWQPIWEEAHPSDEKNRYAMTFKRFIAKNR